MKDPKPLPNCVLIMDKRLETLKSIYEGCSNMSASSFITFFTNMLRQNVIPF